VKELIIYQKVYDLILYIFPIVAKFPKNQRFVLGQQIENGLINLEKLIVQANKEKDKKRTLFKVDVELEQVRLLFRLAHDLGFINMKKYEHISEGLAEIGRLLGGWMRRVRQS